MEQRSWPKPGKFSAIGLTAAVALTLAACGGGSSRGLDGAVVQVNERDFKISLEPAKVPAGVVVLRVRNHGPDMHELIVVRAADAARLPLRPDGMTVNEEAVARVTVATLEAGEPGSVREIQVRLAPGRYVLLCNMAGHFMGGMHAPLVVG